jgi:hypothetical protein
MKRLPRQWSADDLLADLKQRGAPDVAVGIYGQLAGQAVPLAAAVRTVFAAQYGDLISLVPGRLFGVSRVLLMLRPSRQVRSGDRRFVAL